MTAIPEKTESQELIIFETPESVLESIKDADSTTYLIGLIKSKALTVTQDMTTDKGRKAIISLGESVKKTRIYIEERVKDRSKEMKAAIDELKGRGERVTSELNLFIEEIKKPVYEFNKKEEARKAALVNAVFTIKNLGVVSFNATSQEIESRIAQLDMADPTDWQEFAKDAQTAKDSARAALAAALPQVAERERLLEIAAKAAQAEAQSNAQQEIAKPDFTGGGTTTIFNQPDGQPAQTITLPVSAGVQLSKFGYAPPKSTEDKCNEIKSWLIDSAGCNDHMADYLINSLLINEFPHVQLKV